METAGCREASATEGIDRLRAGRRGGLPGAGAVRARARVGRQRERAQRRSRARHADGRAARHAHEAELAVVDLDGTLVDGPLLPTSELPLHLAVYRNFDAGAVVHTHPPMATAVACVADELPCIHYTLLSLGGSVRVAPYATFGTAELAATVVERCEGAARRSWAATAPSPTAPTSPPRWPRPSCSSGPAASTCTPARAAPPGCSTRTSGARSPTALATYGDPRAPRPPPSRTAPPPS